MKILTHEGLQYFYNQIAAKFSTKEQTAEAIEEAVGNAGVGTVTSVNGKTGVVQLSASDVGALPASTQIPSIAGLATETYVDNKVASMVDSAPETLNTLNELAAALGDDPNFATTVATEIGGKVSKSGDTMTGALTSTGYVVKNDWPCFSWSNKGGTVLALAQLDHSNNRLGFHQKRGGNSVWESNEAYFLPTPNLDQTATAAYDILTSKNPVTIAQGGTGATTAQDAAHSLIRGNAIAPANIEFWPASDTATHGGYIDFHFNQASDDYTSRIIESAKGELSINILSDVRVGNITYGNWKGSTIPVAYGGTGATDRKSAFSNLAFIGNNPITSITDDTPTKWTELGTGYARFGQNNCIADQPYTYGILINYAYYQDIAQIWLSLSSSKKMYTRAGNASGWFSSWTAVYDTVNKPSAADVGALSTSGGTLTGTLTLPGNLYAEGDTLDATQYALDMHNSNIVGANGIYMNDASDGITEGIHFYRSSTAYDSIWAARGKLYFTPNRPLKGAGTAYTVYHTGNKPTPAEIGALPTNPGSIEMSPGASSNHGGFIDFHYNGSTFDHTSRIIEDSENYLNINAFEGGKVKLGRVTAGTWNGSAIPVANGGTGATDAVTARTNLGITPENIGAAPAFHTHNFITDGNASAFVGVATTPILSVRKGSYNHWGIERVGDSDNRLTWHYYDPSTGNWQGNAILIDSNGGTINGAVTINNTLTATKVIGAVYA